MLKLSIILAVLFALLVPPSAVMAQERTTIAPSQSLQQNQPGAGLRQIRLPQLHRDGTASFAAQSFPQEIKCNGSCLCEGAGDCVNLVYSGCCGGAITCGDKGCSCVNTGGCDADGNAP